jgi:hypothetical protein
MPYTRTQTRIPTLGAAGSASGFAVFFVAGLKKDENLDA